MDVTKGNRHCCVFGLDSAQKWNCTLVGAESSGWFVPRGSWNSYARYNEIAQPWKPFRIGHMYIYTFLLRTTNTITCRWKASGTQHFQGYWFSKSLWQWLTHCTKIVLHIHCLRYIWCSIQCFRRWLNFHLHRVGSHYGNWLLLFLILILLLRVRVKSWDILNTRLVHKPLDHHGGPEMVVVMLLCYTYSYFLSCNIMI
jgi:hypothetical protein